MLRRSRRSRPAMPCWRRSKAPSHDLHSRAIPRLSILHNHSNKDHEQSQATVEAHRETRNRVHRPSWDKLLMKKIKPRRPRQKMAPRRLPSQLDKASFNPSSLKLPNTGISPPGRPGQQPSPSNHNLKCKDCKGSNHSRKGRHRRCFRRQPQISRANHFPSLARSTTKYITNR